MIKEDELNTIIKNLPQKDKDRIIRNISRNYCLITPLCKGRSIFKIKLTDKLSVKNNEFLIPSTDARKILIGMSK